MLIDAEAVVRQQALHMRIGETTFVDSPGPAVSADCVPSPCGAGS